MVIGFSNVRMLLCEREDPKLIRFRRRFFFFSYADVVIIFFLITLQFVHLFAKWRCSLHLEDLVDNKNTSLCLLHSIRSNELVLLEPPRQKLNPVAFLMHHVRFLVSKVGVINNDCTFRINSHDSHDFVDF